MAEIEPTLGQLWNLIERDSQLTRQHVKETLDDVKERLNTFVTKDHFEAEKRLLEARVSQAERQLRAQETAHNALKEKLDNEARAATQSREYSRREFVYKGIIPALSLVIAGLALYFAR
jgi:hypothetical protein